MTEIEELFEALAECKALGVDRLWFMQNADGTYAIGYGDDVVATSTSRAFAAFMRLAMNKMPPLLEAAELAIALADDTALTPLGMHQAAAKQRAQEIAEKLK